MEEKGGPCSWALHSFRRTFRQRYNDEDELIRKEKGKETWASVEIQKLPRNRDRLRVSRVTISDYRMSVSYQRKKKRFDYLFPAFAPDARRPPSRQRSILCQVTMDFEK